ncbi:MAG: hypothetical protein ACO24Y_03100 [Hylemonella sp.]
MNSEHLELRSRLEALAIDYWHDVDSNGGVGAAKFYVDDGIYATTIREYRGHDAIEDFYLRRRDRGARVSLHLVNNFRLANVNAERVHCQYILSLLAADGQPVLPSQPAILVAVVDEVLVKQIDGAWLYESRRITPLFRGETPTTG